MKVHKLDHVNVRTANLQGMIDWYGEVLGMHPGKRPDFKFGGAWLYACDQAAIHLVEVPEQPLTQALCIEHYAFSATGMQDFVTCLTDRGIAHTLDPVPGFPIVQINLADPDGNHIHVDFPAEEAGNLI